ncbi:Stf0 family sulfotransferase [Geomonas subterranea]|uniref:Sulphotransferase Stf0 domain-containing protein n=1 Tax=Geomonas subterranea TaxID=2847989 RepID=A0ABX8LFU3_9BACT|nr:MULTISPECIES: Stf0 family sulfotransferase [Geomonas]QXE90920.1 hypothetical protein KP001_21515 [Geomonas subterranea]QXM10994.1 hypothetical protein KP002_07755 [Geomonas subterranea]
MNNNILNFFGADASNLSANRVESHDWQADGIDCIYIIFITGRCGSTWLTHLLEDSGICGHPHELFNETLMPRFNKSIEAANFREYFAGAVTQFSSGGRFGFKIDEWRLSHLLPLIDFRTLFPADITRCFWMTRRDLVSQAFSFGRAKTTGHWHDFTAKTTEQKQDHVELSDAQMWKELIDILAKERRMAAFFQREGIDYFPLDYEQMLADRLLTVMRVMIELGCQHEEINSFIQKMEDKTLRLEFGNKYEVLGRFCAKYGKLLTTLDKERKELSTDELRRRLQLDYDLSL